MFRFLHTADWQIGKAFAKMPDDASVPLREQRIATIKKIAKLACEHNVNAVLVAGDVFEFETVGERILHQTIHAMSGFTGYWIMLPGNHDPGTPEGVWAQLRRLQPPENVIIMDKPGVFEIAEKSACILAAPLQRKHEAVDITEWFNNHKTEATTIRIGLAHGSMDNRLPDRGEAPNTISDRRAQQADLDYLALGDWHGTISVDKKVWYSGTHETDRFRTNDSGNVLLVEVDSHGAPPSVTAIPTGQYRWKQHTVDIDDTDGAQLVDRVVAALAEPPETLVLQLTLTGTADLETRAQLDRVITRWSGLLRYLEVRDQGLASRASDDDLDQLGQTGFIGETVRRLKAQAEDSNNADRETAAAALNLLFMEHKQTVNKR